MVREERPDAASRIIRVLVLVARPYDDTEHPDQTLVFVHEGMLGVGVFLDVMLDVVSLERAFQLRRPAPLSTSRGRRSSQPPDRLPASGEFMPTSPDDHCHRNQQDRGRNGRISDDEQLRHNGADHGWHECQRAIHP